jgi:outer membrane protein TolC
MSALRIWLCLACAALSALAQTNAPEPREMSLEDCIEIALHHNLDVQIKRYNPELSRFTLEGSYGAYDPFWYGGAEHDYKRQPSSSLDEFGRPIPGQEADTDNYSTGFRGLLPWGMNYDLGISMNNLTTLYPDRGTNVENFAGQAGFLRLNQPLLKNAWIDNTRLQIFLDKKNLKISELDLRSQVMTTVTAVEQAYYNLIFSQENVKVQQKALELAERQLAENKKRVEVGAMAPLDEKQAESQVAGSRADLLNAVGNEQTQQRVLKSLLSDDYSKWEKVSIKPTESLTALPEKFNLQESWRKGLSQRPDLLQQKINLEKQDYTIRYQKNQLLPQLDVTGTAGYGAGSPTFGGYLDQLGGRDNPFYSVGGQIAIPLGNTSARNSYRTAKATREQITLQLKQLEQNVLIQIENDIAVANTRFQQVDATREARIYAEAALDAEQKKLESGKSTSFVVLQLTRDLTSARSAEISALANYNNALAQLALDEGDTLDRRHVALEIK